MPLLLKGIFLFHNHTKKSAQCVTCDKFLFIVAMIDLSSTVAQLCYGLGLGLSPFYAFLRKKNKFVQKQN